MERFQRRDDCLDYRGNERYSNTRMNEFGGFIGTLCFRRERQGAGDTADPVLDRIGMNNGPGDRSCELEKLGLGHLGNLCVFRWSEVIVLPKPDEVKHSFCNTN